MLTADELLMRLKRSRGAPEASTTGVYMAIPASHVGGIEAAVPAIEELRGRGLKVQYSNDPAKQFGKKEPWAHMISLAVPAGSQL